MQTDQSRTTITLADGAGHTFKMLAGVGASIHGKTLFDRSSGWGCGVDDGRSHVPVDGEVVWRERCQRCEVVAAFPGYGEAAAYWMGGHRPRVLAGERDWLLARLAEKPDLTLRAVVAELVGRGVPASYGAVWRLLKAEGITVKKSLFAAEKDRPDLACRRQRWKHQSRLDPHRLVFIDETPAFAGTGSGPRPT